VLQESVGGMFSSESALSHTSRKFGGIADSLVSQAVLTQSPTTSDQGDQDLGRCRCWWAPFSITALAHCWIKTFSCADTDGNIGTLAKALIHPLWFSLWKVFDQAVN